MEINRAFDGPDYRSYEIIMDPEVEYRYPSDRKIWVFTSWHTTSKVTDHIKGDLMVKVIRGDWGDVCRVTLEGERRATSFERACMAMFIEVTPYDPEPGLF